MNKKHYFLNKEIDFFIIFLSSSGKNFFSISAIFKYNSSYDFLIFSWSNNKELYLLFKSLFSFFNKLNLLLINSLFFIKSHMLSSTFLSNKLLYDSHSNFRALAFCSFVKIRKQHTFSLFRLVSRWKLELSFSPWLINILTSPSKIK